MTRLDELERLLVHLAVDPRTAKSCAYGARRAAEALRGVVAQYGVAENPTQTLLRRPESGHCFALVDGWLVDPWAIVTGRGRGLYRFDDLADAAEVRRLYGPWTCWRFNPP